jgi:hypothetical protein
MTVFYQILSGAIMMGSWVAGAFFFRFWKKTRDPLFYLFGISFWMMAAERIAIAFLADVTGEKHSYIYLIRLASFVLILVAIANKSRTEKLR